MMEARQIRGLQIAQSKRIAKLAEHLWAVPSQTHNGKYMVTEEGTCLCPDFETHGGQGLSFKCKHIWALEFSRHLVTAPDGASVMTDTLRITYRQPWAAYNAAQVNEKDTVEHLLRGL